MRTRTLAATLLIALALAPAARAETVTWTLTNHAGRYENELVRLGAAPKTPYDGRKLVVTEDGQVVPHQVEVLEGTLRAVRKANIWVATTIDPKASHTYEISTDGPGAKASSA